MTLAEESAEAFGEMQAVFTTAGGDASTITFNGITRPCLAASLNLKRAQQLQGYQIENAQEVVMLASDFADFDGIKDRVSKVKVNDDDELMLMASDRHPQSATVHLFLLASK